MQYVTVLFEDGVSQQQAWVPRQKLFAEETQNQQRKQPISFAEKLEPCENPAEIRFIQLKIGQAVPMLLTKPFELTGIESLDRLGSGQQIFQFEVYTRRLFTSVPGRQFGGKEESHSF